MKPKAVKAALLMCALAVPVSFGQTNSSSQPAAQAITTNVVVGQGTAGKIAKFVGRKTIGNSIMTEKDGGIAVHGSFDAVVNATPGIGLHGGNETSSGSGDSEGSGIIGILGDTSSPAGVGVFGRSYAETGNPIGVLGKTRSVEGGAGAVGSCESSVGSCTGVVGEVGASDQKGGVFVNYAQNGYPTGMFGVSMSADGGFGVVASTLSSTGYGIGLSATANSPDAYAGSFANYAPGGNLIKGFAVNSIVFRVDGSGTVYANGGFQPGGADFAESMVVSGDRSKYVAGDLLVIDSTAKRQLALAQQPYSTLVAGIYSTKPGMLGSTRAANEPTPVNEVPLAVVGIVPCKVTAENGAIQVGDLLVTSTVPGHAMKGTDRSKMLGAVVGKALEPLPNGEATIHVLVTLQ